MFRRLRRLEPATRAVLTAVIFLSMTAALSCQRAPEATRTTDPARTPRSSLPRRVFLGSQITCVTGGASPTRCVGEAAFQVPGDLKPLEQATEVDFGLRHGCMLDGDGRALCWGCCSEGQLGYDPKMASQMRRGRPCCTTPKPLPDAPPMTAIAAGWLHTCGITKKKTVVCWGDNSLGQLGRSKPGPEVGKVGGLAAPVEAIAAGSVHTCVLEDAGRVACWGDGSEGQLGDGRASDSRQPVFVQGLPGRVVEIAAGAYHTCARLTDGTVSCWGENRFGQLGDGTRLERDAAVSVVGLPGKVRSLVAGSSFTCALLEKGGVACWGSNEMGELGVGTVEVPPLTGEKSPAPSPPRLVEKLPGRAEEVFAAGNHACAKLADQSIWCWGANEYGQLGDGTLEMRALPVAWKGAGADLPRPKLADLTRGGAGPLEGLDVSYHSGRVDWRAAAAHGSRFALTLATAGDDFRDPFFACHWERMRQAGLLRGAYHFFVAEDDPADQARTFLSHVVFEPGDFAPVVDIEKLYGEAPPDLAKRLEIFLDAIEAKLGVKPIIYTGPGFWNKHFRHGGFGDYPLWLAQYDVSEPQLPAGWKRWAFWQWRGNAHLPDVAPVVDLDRLGPNVDLAKLLIPQSRPTSLKPTPPSTTN